MSSMFSKMTNYDTHPKHPLPKSCVFATLILARLLCAGAAELDLSKLPPPASRKVDFVADIQPILAKSCYACHGPEKQKAELRWDVRSIALQGGEHGPVILPGKSSESVVIHLVAGLKGDDKVMPQKGERLSSDQISLLRAWIDQGADLPDSASIKIADKRAHWAFKAPVRPPLPEVRDQSRARTGIERCKWQRSIPASCLRTSTCTRPRPGPWFPGPFSIWMKRSQRNNMNLQEEIRREQARLITRLWFFRQCGVGLGSVALASMLGDEQGWAEAPGKPTDPLSPRKPHYAAKAKRVIYLFMGGAPSQLDLFDPKPVLAKYNGRPVPPEVVMAQKYAFIKPDAELYATEFKFSRHGQCGAELSEALPYLAEVVDDIAIVKSMTTDAFNHAPGQVLMQTGSSQFGRPCMGAWVLYGLGSQSRDLPGFVVLNSAGSLSGGAALYGSGFLPTIYQGVPFRKSGDPVLFLSNPAGITDKMQRRTLDVIRELNEKHFDTIGDPEISTRINSFEMAYRMQSSAPELMDVSKESPVTLSLYGAEIGKSSFAMNCLLARRLIERGVRFVQLFHEGWDHHSEVVSLDVLRWSRATRMLAES